MPTWGTGEFGETNPWGGVFGGLVIPPGGGDDEPIPGQDVDADGCIHNHRAQALGRLVEQFKDKPNIEALVSALVEPIQRLEDALCQMMHERSLAAGGEDRTAVGAQLDILGAIVGVRRGAMDDDTFARIIDAQIVVNRSTGVLEDFIRIVQLVTNTDTGIVLQRQNHATIVIIPTDDITPPDEADFLMRFLHRAALTGVRVILQFRPQAEEDTFSFENGPGPGFGEGQFAGARSNGVTNQPII